jgi:hypothetical protein
MKVLYWIKDGVFSGNNHDRPEEILINHILIYNQMQHRKQNPPPERVKLKYSGSD